MKTVSAGVVAKILSGFLIGAVCSTANAEIQLYETGPGVEVSYVRFVNATEKKVSIIASGKAGRIELGSGTEDRVSRFYKIKSAAELVATVQSGAQKSELKVVGKPWEYITVAVLPNGNSPVGTVQIKETPEDFNAMRASLALFNLDASCAHAQLQGGAKNVSILTDVKPLTVQRRLLNPLKLSANVSCDEALTSVDLPPLQAGERYSLYSLKLKDVRQLIFAQDKN